MSNRFHTAPGQLPAWTTALAAMAVLALLMGTTVIAAAQNGTNRLVLITEPEPSVTFSTRVPIQVRYVDPDNQPIPDAFVAFEPQGDMADTSLRPQLALTDKEGVAETYIEAGVQKVDFDVKISVPDDDTVTPLTVAVRVRPAGIGDKVTLCHKPGTPDEATLKVSARALRAHLKHGDYPGVCEAGTASIIGTKYEDLDADGSAREAGENGLGGWTIFVDYDNDSIWDTDMEPHALTASDGSYAITDIKPGSWNVREIAQDGWNCSFPNDGIEKPPVISGGCAHSITIFPSRSVAGVDFGNWTGAVQSGYKWEDHREPYGEWDQTNEPPLPGWTIDLWDITTGTPVFVAASNTDGSGFYAFEQVDPGRTYIVCEWILFSYYQTFPAASSTPPAGETIFNCSAELGKEYGPYGYQFSAQSGDTYLSNNFGNKESQ